MRSFAVLSTMLVAGAAAQSSTSSAAPTQPSDPSRLTGLLGDAAPINDNPIGAEYFAELPNSPKNTVRGSVKATSNPDGKGVHFEINFSGFPAEGGPFAYHIHSTPVPEDGDCAKTLAHLDPYQRGQFPNFPKCDKTKPQTCEVGDLSGKHGAIEGTAFSANYVDAYASLKEGIGAFFGNRSITLHRADSSRITCANFVKRGSGAPVPIPSGGFTSVVGPNGTAPPVSSPTYSPPANPTKPTNPGDNPSPPNAAARAGLSAAALLAAAAAFVL